MNFSIYLKSFFVINLLWVSVSYSMHLIIKEKMTPHQAVKKCIEDCNYRGLRELIHESSYTAKSTSRSLNNDRYLITKKFKSNIRKAIGAGLVELSLIAGEMSGLFTPSAVMHFCSCLTMVYYAYKMENSFQSNKLLIDVDENIIKVKGKEDLI